MSDDACVQRFRVAWLWGTCCWLLLLTGCTEGTLRLGSAAPIPPLVVSVDELDEPTVDPGTWDIVRTWPARLKRDQGVADGDRVLILRRESGRRVGVVEDHDGRQLIRNVPPAGKGWQTIRGMLIPGAAVFSDWDPRQGRALLRAYSLPSGTPVDWLPEEGVLGAWSIGIGLEWAAYLTATSSAKTCLHGIDIAAERQGQLICGDRDQVWWGPVVSGDQAVIVQESGQKSETPCWSVRSFSLESGVEDSGAPAVVNEHAECRIRAATPIADGLAWEEGEELKPEADEDVVDVAFRDHNEQSEGFYTTADGHVTALGELNPGSLISCGGALYWQESTEISVRMLRWVPGDEAAATVWATTRKSVWRASCVADRYRACGPTSSTIGCPMGGGLRRGC